MIVDRKRRWRTKLGAWVREYGASRLAADLGVSGRFCIYHWTSGRCDPRPDFARRIVDLSDGQLAMDDVYGISRPGPRRS